MARGINKVILVGNCGQDPETRYTSGGAAVTNVSIATSEAWKDKQTGQTQERTEWHRVVFYNRLGEITGEYLRKGSKVYIEGSLRTRKWQDQQGIERYTTEIVANEMQMLDSRENNSAPASDDRANAAYGERPAQAPQRPASGRPTAPPQGQPMGAHNHGQPPAMDDFDSDIPF